jgi:hypothetical protein
MQNLHFLLKKDTNVNEGFLGRGTLAREGSRKGRVMEGTI